MINIHNILLPVNILSHVLYLFRDMYMCTFVCRPDKIYSPPPASGVFMFPLHRHVKDHITCFGSTVWCRVVKFKIMTPEIMYFNFLGEKP